MNEKDMLAEIHRQCDEIEMNGFSIVRNLIDRDVVSELSRHADSAWRRLADPSRPRSKVEIAGAEVEAVDAVRSVAREARLLGTMLALLGPNIYVNYAGFTINPPQARDKAPMEFHTDGGRISREHIGSAEPRYSIKTSVWLTDGAQLGVGNFHVIPGSHKWRSRPHVDLDALAVPVLVNAGDAIIFERRVWHTRKPNMSSKTRKVLFLDYAPRWMERKCPSTALPLNYYPDSIENQLFNNQAGWSAFAPKKHMIPCLPFMQELGITRREEPVG
ncbi:phytanoyl-CoA dioxygenase family protein [Burkholderia sp. AcTa6-5]|uniref:phytanoyl-CoA dioxygenase family protein n=1 Tax=Burkholderia TaxID=32008 RepID=UPI001AE88132|nr:phytanoyl-CoA dioxygenase family protein [Burkholderia sp. AcTa6-5]MBP0714299.1 phytanoyl-CoA dioxygenase family protein [Burkholderia sp. AcTa6-5]